MKIHQLAIGARFKYEGEEYVKSGPLFGTGKAGQRLIPKYAVLTPLGEVGVAVDKERSETLSRADVIRAFEAFYVECKTLVPDERQMAMDGARNRFLKAFD